VYLRNLLVAAFGVAKRVGVRVGQCVVMPIELVFDGSVNGNPVDVGERRHAGRAPYNWGTDTEAGQGTHRVIPSDPPSLFELWRTRPTREGSQPGTDASTERGGYTSKAGTVS
jgi:hypothetical protein